MYPLFETICIKDGICQNMEYHISRFQRSFNSLYKTSPAYQFANGLSIPEDHREGLSKLNIYYNHDDQHFIFKKYQPIAINSLKLVEDNNVDYEFKYTNRVRLNQLYEKRQDCDDVLIVKDGLVTDTSICNILFYDGRQWQTPVKPLLKGAMRQKLLDEKSIFEMEITVKKLNTFSHFKLINAMKSFEMGLKIDVKNIHL